MTTPGRAILLVCFLLACGNAVGKRTPDLYQHWISSDEEYDAVRQYRTYRPIGFPFPPSRGREGFEIQEDGTFILHAIAPTDGSLEIKLRWKLENDVLVVSGVDSAHRYRIISVAKDKLVLQDLTSQ